MTGQSTHAEPQPGADPPIGQVWLRRPGGSPEPITIPTGGSLRVGRQNDNDLVLDSSKISRYHIDIKFDGSHYFVTDQHSKNGAFLGGRRLPAGEATLWPPEQMVALGKSGYTFQLSQDIQAQAALAPPVAGRFGAGGLTLTLESDDLQTSAAGQKQITITPGDRRTLIIKLTNDSSGPMQLSLWVPEQESITWTWRSAVPPVVSIPAGRTERIPLTLTPPKGSETQPGEHHLVVRAAAKNDPNATASDACTLIVEPDYEFDSWLDSELVAPGFLVTPETTALLKIENQGNVDQTFDLKFNRSSGLRRLDSNHREVNKGGVEEVEIRPAIFSIGLRPINNVSITVTSQAGGKSQTHNFKSANPRIFLWGLIALFLTAFLCSGFAVYRFVNPPTTPTSVAIETATPISTSTPTPDATGTAKAVLTAIFNAQQAIASAQGPAEQTALAASFENLAAEATAGAGTAAAQEAATSAAEETTAAQEATAGTTGTPSPTPTATLTPSQLSFGEQPPVVVVRNRRIASDITVNILDENGNIVEGATNSVLLELISPVNNLITALTVRTAEDGVATFSDLVIDAAPRDNYRLRASSPNSDLDDADSDPFDLVDEDSPPVAALLVFTQPPTDTQRYNSMSVMVEIRDQFNNKISETGRVVNLAIIDPGSLQESPIGIATTVDGVASFNITANFTPKQNYQMKASSIGLSPAISPPFDITPPNAVSLNFDQQPPGNIVVDDPFNIQVSFRDQEGLLIPTESGEVALTLQDDSEESPFELIGNTIQQARQGIATFSNLSIGFQGEFVSLLVAPTTYYLVARSGELEGISNTFTINPPTPTPTLTPTPTFTPSPTFTPEPEPCQITAVIFDQESYETGDPINITVRLADQAGMPLNGAQVTGDVTRRDIESQASTTISFGVGVGSGRYEAVYTNTDLPGLYEFMIIAIDPTGIGFTPCEMTGETAVVAPLTPEMGSITIRISVRFPNFNDNSDQEIPFVFTGLSNFTLTYPDDLERTFNRPSGEYQIIEETQSSSTDLSEVFCTNDQGNSTPLPITPLDSRRFLVTIPLEAGEDLTCEFRNISYY